MKWFKALRTVIANGAQSKFAYFGFGMLTICSGGCRSTLPPEQPSRLWDVFGRQTGRFHSVSGADIARERAGVGPAVGPAQGGATLPPSSYDLVLPSDRSSVPQARTDAAGPQAYSAQMIPPLPREIR